MNNNAQQAGFVHQYPLPTAPHHLPYPVPYPPPQHVYPYQYYPQTTPQPAQQHYQSAPYSRNLSSVPPGQPSRPPPRQDRQTNARDTANASSQDNAARAPETTSAGMEDVERDLLNALGNSNAQQEQQSEGEQAQDGEENEPIYNLPPPAENTYPSEAELEKAMHAWSLEHGYELVRRASKKNAAGKMYKRYYHCSKHGIMPSKQVPASERKRANRKSNRIGCPMSLACVAVDPGEPDGEWQIRHRKTHHNHPAHDGVSLAGHRRRAREGGVQKAVDGLFSIGTSTAQVLLFLQKTHPNGLFTRTDVANMKLKWKKYGTCTYRPGEDEPDRERAKPGQPRACLHCRQKKMGCGSERPVCTQCQQSGTECQYDFDPPADSNSQETERTPSTSQPQLATPANARQQRQQQSANSVEPPSTEGPLFPGNRRGPLNASQAAATREILEELRSFQAEHVPNERLSLQSSSVEILAQSSCGTGESYRSLPLLSHSSEWPAFRDAMTEAAMKENTWDVLTGTKPEPQKLRDDVDIAEWNEYIKQLAIYKRRNDILLTALWTHLSPNLRFRVQGYREAASIWHALEDLCLPRGSETAFKLFLDLHSITLATSTDLKDYIHRLNSTYERFKLIKLNTSPLPSNQSRAKASTVRTGEEAVTEEMVCFLFLRNLGPDWRRWVEGLVATNNIGGFGTGERLGLKELGKRAEAYRAMQERSL